MEPANILATKSISRNHERVIRATLGMLDEALCEFQQWAQGRELRGVLYQERNVLALPQRKALLDQVHAARRCLEEAAEHLGLEPVVRRAEASIRGACIGLVCDITELGPRYLKGYGAVPVDLAAYMDSLVELLTERLRRMLDAVEDDLDDRNLEERRLSGGAESRLDAKDVWKKNA